MTALAQYTAITARRGATLHNIEVTGPSYDLLCKYDDLLDTANDIRGCLALHGDKPSLRMRAARFACVAKLLLPASCGPLFSTLVNLKTDWPTGWNFIDLSAHIECVMREVREQLEGVTA